MPVYKLSLAHRDQCSERGGFESDPLSAGPSHTLPAKLKPETIALVKGMLSSTANESFVRSLVMACITGCIPFTFIENPHLIAAAKAVGVKLPSRKVLSTTTLNAAFEDIRTATAEELSKLKYIDAASDGWRKKYCEQGAALTNFCALTAVGALLHDVLNCSSLRKDADGIADMLLEAAEKMSGGDCSRIAGWILDNTKANWACAPPLCHRSKSDCCSCIGQFMNQVALWLFAGQ